MTYSDITSGKVNLGDLARERWQVIIDALNYCATDQHWAEDRQRAALAAQEWAQNSKIGDGSSMMQLSDEITAQRKVVADKAATIRRLVDAQDTLRHQLARSEENVETLRMACAREARDAERREWNLMVQDRDNFKAEAERVGLVNARLMATNSIRQRKLSELITQRHAYRTRLAALDKGRPAAEVFGLHPGHSVDHEAQRQLRDALDAKTEEVADLHELVADRMEVYRVLYNKYLAIQEELRQLHQLTPGHSGKRIAQLEQDLESQTRHAQQYYTDLVAAKDLQKRTAADRDEVGELLDSEMERLEKDIECQGEELDRIRAERDQLRLAADSHLYRIAALEELLAEVRQENDSLDSRCATANQERTQALHFRQDAIKEVARLQEELNQTLVQLQTVRAQLQAASTDSLRYRQELDELQKEGSAPALRAQLAHMVKSYTKAKDDRLDALNHAQAVQKETDALRAQVAQMKGTNANLATQVKEAWAERDDTMRSVATQANTIRRLEADLAIGTDSEVLGEALDDCIAERDAALAQQDRLTYLFDMEAAQVRRQAEEIADWKKARDQWEEERAQETEKLTHDLTEVQAAHAVATADRDFYRARLADCREENPN